MLSILGNINSAESVTEIQFSDGRVVRVPTALLQEETQELPQPADAIESGETMVLPLIEEQLQVSKRTNTTGHVRLQKSVGAYDVQLDESLAVSTVEVERVPLGHIVEIPPGVRQEGDTLIYPILEERLVLTKELVLVEEVRVTQLRSERRDTRVVTLRRERMDVQREEAERA